MAEDGSVVIVANMDVGKAEKDLAKLREKIVKLTDELSTKKSRKSELEEQTASLGARLDEARMKLEEMKSVGSRGIFSSSDIANQREEVSALQKAFNSSASEMERVDAAIKNTTNTLNGATTEAQTLQQGISKASESTEHLADNTNKTATAAGYATSAFGKFEHRVAGLIKRVFVFSVITLALRNLRKWLSNVVAGNAEATAAIAQLKASLLTLAQPILNVVVPAFIRLIQIITAVINRIINFFAMITGGSKKEWAQQAQALNAEQAAIAGVGGAAEDASKQLASFDEINKLEGSSQGGGGGAGGAAGADFSELLNGDDLIDDSKLRKILDIVTAIGAALLAWKIGDALGLGLRGIIGLAMALWGIIKFIREYLDAWNNGITMDNLVGMLLGLTALAAGLFLLFGKVGAAIGLIVGGIAMLVLGIKDIIENGVTLENKLTTIAGLMALGIGIGILTGSWIPALIAGIISVGIYFADLAGQGELLRTGLTNIFEGFSEFFRDVFVNHDMKAAVEDLKKIWLGIKQVAEAICEGLKYAWQSFIDWLNEHASPEIAAIVESFGKMFSDLWLSVKEILGGIIDFITGVFTGDWEKAWDGLKTILKGILNMMIDLFEGFLNIGQRLVGWIIDALNKISFDIPEWVPIFGGKTFAPHIVAAPQLISLPRLATGAVIPPNREFLAMLGDQKQGNNIEAPEALIRKIVREETGGIKTNGGVKQPIYFQIDKRTFAKVIVDLANMQDQFVGVQLGGSIS